jgi:tetratricopeptide (TPR) repeat protein
MATGRRELAEPYFKKVAETTRTDEARIALADYYMALDRLAEAQAILEPINEEGRLHRTGADSGSLRLPLRRATVRKPAASFSACWRRRPSIFRRECSGSDCFWRMEVLTKPLVEAAALATEEGSSAAAAEANLIIGAIENGRDRTAQAIRAFEEVLRIQPQNLAAALTLAQGAFARGQLGPRPDLRHSGCSPRNPATRWPERSSSGTRLLRNDMRQAEARTGQSPAGLPKRRAGLELDRGARPGRRTTGPGAGELPASRHKPSRTIWRRSRVWSSSIWPLGRGRTRPIGWRPS